MVAHSIQARLPQLMVVEDDEDLRELIARTARQDGFDVVAAESGERALEIMRMDVSSIDWLLTDIRLPGIIDGWVVGSEFRLRHPLRPIIYMSGMEDDIPHRASGSIFLRKPVIISDLLTAFERLGAASAEAGRLGPGSPHRPYG